ncbi:MULTISPECIES: glycosyltransferase family 39 protein [unclassified Nocardia]|uniref:ArnT family glycosyltransferase n=1 Tax=unclassified Nocardia TaxID=2637762 RepID=UPI001CE3D21A|nr:MULTISPECIES: glycosyltransferase family 39 protein [unclassified Nocardia]
MTETLEMEAVQGNTATARPPFAYLGVGVLLGLSAVALLFSSGRYGFFGDEMYFVAAGHRLSFGYADQGPVLPLIARLMDELASGSLVALRLPAVLVTLAAIVFSALIAREFGGSRTAQVLAAAAYATSPFLLLQGAQLSTNVIDSALWVPITWLLIRWVRTRHDVLLLWAGIVTAVDMQVKWLIPAFWIAVVLSVFACGPRELLRRPLLWAGGAITLAATVPTLVWQARHGWPQLGMTAQVAAEQSGIGGRVLFVPIALISAGGLGVFLLVTGLIALFRWEPLRPYRFLAPVQLLVVVAFVATNGRPYYVVGCYAAVMAAGAVWWTRKPARWRRFFSIALTVTSAVVVVLLLPLKPESELRQPDSDQTAGLQIGLYGKFGWPELREGTAAAYSALPAADREHAVVITDNYWQASALDVQRGRYGLPAIYSPNRGFGYFGTPPDTATTVLWVGGSQDELRKHFDSVTPIGRVDSRLGFPDVTRDVTIWRCDRPHTPWSTAWPGMLNL